MTREIKFRAKRLRTGEWVYGWYVGYSESSGYIHGDYVDKDEVWGVDAQTVGQYTGLKDKNGVEIYEGDILRFLIHPSLVEEASDSELLHQVIWAENGFYLWEWMSEDMKPFSPFGITTLFEVEGNIHDTPDLLKEAGNDEQQ